MTRQVNKSEKDWRKVLTPEQFSVCRQKATERAFTGKYYDCKDTGVYLCVCCNNRLFDAEKKYNSGSGWPSFWKAIENATETKADNSLGMRRVEVLCRRCDAHLGHVFEDGPQPTGLRYCINSISLELKKD